MEGDVLSIKVERSKTAEAPAPDTAGDAAADDGDFAMVGAEGGEHGQNCGADAGAPDDGEGASGSADVKCACQPCFPCQCISAMQRHCHHARLLHCNGAALAGCS